MGSYFGTGVTYVVFLICWHMISCQHCDKHETVYKTTGGAMRLNVTGADSDIFPNVTVRHVRDGNEHDIFYLYFGKERIEDEFYFPESSFQMRIYMDITSSELEKLEFAITIRDLRESDYGNFIVDGLNQQICWALIILKTVPVPRLSENHSIDGPQLLEGSSATFFANKSDLVSTSPINVTTVWLIDDVSVNSNYHFNATEEILQILNTPKELNGKILTYRAIVEGDKIAYETNLTLTVGECKIVLVPERSIYVLDVGDTIPPITCTARCFVAFSVHWESGPVIYNSSILDLGKTDFGKSRMFTCWLRVDNFNMISSRDVFLVVMGALDGVWTAITALSVSVGMLGTAVVIIVIVVSLGHRGNNIWSCLKNKESAVETPMQGLRPLTEPQNYTSLQQRNLAVTEELYMCLNEAGPDEVDVSHQSEIHQRNNSKGTKTFEFED